MNNNIRVGNLFGIPFYINPSWFLVLALVTLSYGGDLARYPQLPGILPWFLGLVTALLLFASVVAHELGHSFVAISQGINVKSISLFLFGGLATLEKDSDNPSGAFWVAIAGPLVSFFLFGIFTVINLTITLPAPLKTIVYLVGYINLVLALFNLIPGLPLDGGNILKAIVWKITGNPNKGLIFAGRVGQIFGWIAVIIGILAILGISPVGSFWTLLIGGFLLQNAGFAAQSGSMQEKLNSFTAEDAVIPDSPIVAGDLNLREFANDYIIGKKSWHKFLVTNSEGQLIGVLSVDEMKKVATSDWNHILVSELMESRENIKTIPSNLSLLEVAKLLETQKENELTVVKENDVVIGLLEKASIVNLIQQQSDAKTA